MSRRGLLGSPRDGLALEAESDVGVDAGGDADVGVAEEFLDDDEFDALLQERALKRLKFSAALPTRLAEATLAARLADLKGAAAALREPSRFMAAGQ
ncbi:hypothetical protein M2266_002306 [Streptomyces sp. SPB162]|nr:hypothetical protein [Streptomyces sp. SPB162]